jgi:hypothetical protein
MSLPPNPMRKPYSPATPSSEGDGGADVADRRGEAPLLPVTASAVLTREAAKLSELRTALWSAFQSSSANSLPQPLIDLAIAYTGALRLELNLLGTSRPSSSRSPRVEPRDASSRQSSGNMG